MTRENEVNIMELIEEMNRLREIVDAMIGAPEGASEYCKKEAAMYGMNGPVYAYDSYTEEFMGEFRTYWDFRKEYGGAEIVCDEMLAPGKGCKIYC